jgi:ubiquinone/menaquinone biosynthesis C-methylase UbiE
MMGESAHDTTVSTEIAGYYDQGREAARLDQGAGLLELVRTQELLLRYLPPPPAVIYDIGGGPGAYALWLATLGYTVHLLDAMPLHIAQAERAAAAQPDHPLASTMVGDARQLPYLDTSGDAALLMGPLYHLTDHDDRLAALREARRVLRPGGLTFAVAIGRTASALSGLFAGFIHDPTFAAIVRRDLIDGQHRNPTRQLGYFTTAYFHRPEDLAREVADAGLRPLATLPIEGPVGLLPDLAAHFADNTRREALLETLRWLENEPMALHTSAHIMTIAVSDK